MIQVIDASCPIHAGAVSKYPVACCQCPECEHPDAYKPEGWRANLYCPDCEVEVEPEGLDGRESA